MKLPRGTRLLTTDGQVAAVSSPVRIEILEHLMQAGRSSVAELAALMGRPATALHYHLNVLYDAGVVRVAGSRKAGKRSESLFVLAARSFAVGGGPRDKRSIGHQLRTLGATVRLAQREAGRALRTATACGQGPGRTFHSRRMRALLSPTALRRVNRLLDELEGVFARDFKRQLGKRGGRKSPAGDVVSLTFLLTPAGSARPRARPRGGDKS